MGAGEKVSRIGAVQVAGWHTRWLVVGLMANLRGRHTFRSIHSYRMLQTAYVIQLGCKN